MLLTTYSAVTQAASRNKTMLGRRPRMAIDTACVFPLKPLLLTLVTVFTHPYAFAQNANVLPDIAVNESPTPVQKYQLPATTESVTAAQLAETVNVTNTEDALKYLPS